MKNYLDMYKENIYVINHEKLNSDAYDVSTSMDMLDKELGIKHNDLARAQYCHWLAMKYNNPQYLGAKESKLLGLKPGEI